MMLHNKEVLDSTPRNGGKRKRKRRQTSSTLTLRSSCLEVQKQSSSVQRLEPRSAQLDGWTAPLDSAHSVSDRSLASEPAAPEAPKLQCQKHKEPESGGKSQHSSVKKRPVKRYLQEQPEENPGPSCERRTEHKILESTQRNGDTRKRKRRQPGSFIPLGSSSLEVRKQSSGVRCKSQRRSTEEDAPVKKRPMKRYFQEQSEENPGPSCDPRTERKTCFKELYHKGSLLGSGGFGSVFAGVRKADGLPVAIKYVSKLQAEEQIAIAGLGKVPLEVGLMTLVNSVPCPNILQLLEWFDEPRRYIMILERPDPCQDVDGFCWDNGGRLNENVARGVMKQLIKALHHCNSCGVLHRDVKPENILIQTDTHEVKLFDFGCGDLLKSSYREFAGTARFAPPEWFLHRRYRPEEATVWSVGVTLFSMVCGFLPYGTSRETIEGDLRFPEGLTQECRHLIHWCLSPDGADRPSLEEMELHPWFQ